LLIKSCLKYPSSTTFSQASLHLSPCFTKSIIRRHVHQCLKLILWFFHLKNTCHIIQRHVCHWCLKLILWFTLWFFHLKYNQMLVSVNWGKERGSSSKSEMMIKQQQQLLCMHLEQQQQTK
jgi:hypothetical protein